MVFRFSVGKLILLGKSSSASSSDDEYCKSNDTDLCDFPWYKRWWEKSGMGASIGLRCSNSVSATLGGYVFINHQPFLLTVDHFIDKALAHKKDPTATTLDSLTLTSPSLLDVNDMIATLEQSIRNIKADVAQVVNSLGTQDLSSNDMKQLYDSGGDLRQLTHMHDVFNTLREELRKDEEEFVLGKVTYRCRSKEEKPSYYDATPLPQSSKDPVIHRMDWALCEVNSARCGINRHRYRSDEDSMDCLCPDAGPHGLGKLCQATCDPESYTPIYFAGQKSGINHGQIGSSLINCCINGTPTREWSIIVPTPASNKNTFAGDSGAWILRESDHRVLGQLWGFQDGLLLFTPINDIFADITNTVDTKNVGLQYRYLDPDTSPIYPDVAMNDSAALICEYKKPKDRKTKTYKIPFRKTIVPRKSSLIVDPHPGTLSVVNPLGAVLPNNCAAAEIVPGSPVPSLASSISSSNAPGPETPEYCEDTKTEHRSLNSLDLLAQPSKHHVKIRPDNIEETEATTDDERRSSVCTIQALQDRPIYNVADETNKHSLRFVLHDVETDLTFDKIHLPDLYPLTGFRKSQTFPMYNKPLKPQSQASVTAVV
ncbi:hypothetical protein MMC17_010234 [Xylographa soralifera]|nr:hypothetical protein [Xylographa soralifera]